MNSTTCGAQVFPAANPVVHQQYTPAIKTLHERCMCPSLGQGQNFPLLPDSILCVIFFELLTIIQTPDQSKHSHNKQSSNPRNGNKYNILGPRVAVGLRPNVCVMKSKAYCKILHTDLILMHPTLAAYSHPKHLC